MLSGTKSDFMVFPLYGNAIVPPDRKNRQFDPCVSMSFHVYLHIIIYILYIWLHIFLYTTITTVLYLFHIACSFLSMQQSLLASFHEKRVLVAILISPQQRCSETKTTPWQDFCSGVQVESKELPTLQDRRSQGGGEIEHQTVRGECSS